MPEEVLFETEQRLDRSEVADYLRTVADNLDAGNDITLQSGEESLTLEPPSSVEFEVKSEREGQELSLEFELEWAHGDEDGDGGLEIS